jgi:hypothetical protein
MILRNIGIQRRSNPENHDFNPKVATSYSPETSRHDGVDLRETHI